MVEGDKSTYLTEGILRASHRVLGKAPYNNLGLPYHRYYKSDLVSIPAGDPVELVFDLLPISYQFRAGNRMRISITCADADNFETPTLNPQPKIRLLRNSAHASFVEFSIIPGRWRDRDTYLLCNNERKSGGYGYGFLQLAAVDFLLKCSFYFQPIHSTFESPTFTFHHALQKMVDKMIIWNYS